MKATGYMKGRSGMRMPTAQEIVGHFGPNRAEAHSYARHPQLASAFGEMAGQVILGNRYLQQVNQPEPERQEDESGPAEVLEHLVGSDGLVDEEISIVQSGHTCVPSVGFSATGRTETVPYGHPPGPGHWRCPLLFTDGGRTGNVVFAGGGGAGPHGNQPAGSIQAEVVPVFESVSHGALKDSEAWVMPGTGNVDVTRSFVDSGAGDQGNGWYLTAAAAARATAHEQLHVDNSKAHYVRLIDPLLIRKLARRTAFTRWGAKRDLREYVRWPETIKEFQRDDAAANRAMGSVDVADLASPTFPVDAGPGVAGGKNFLHIARLPAEPNPI
ncbi:hypothetical protein ACIBG8_42940 [Nonomuraea sp. NPDC050556]|uniref:hypothetical protein n=1 Tax=Nonomuraea sp. NPDC050556 TaxID=3364369 RepID=UPI0037A76469